MIWKVVAIAIGTLVIATSSYAAREARHMRLVRSVPASDATITAFPSSIRLWFSESPEIAVSRITLTLDGDDIAVGKTRGDGDSSLVVDISSRLAPGRYTVRWRPAGDDGPVLRDSFGFTLADSDRRP